MAGAWLLLVAGCSLPPAKPELTVHAPSEQHPTGRIEVRGVAAQAQDLRVRVATASRKSPDMLGQALAEGASLTFVPRFALQSGLTYRVFLQGQPTVDLRFTLPPPLLEPRATVLAVYPDAEELPANLLKLYLHFSGPMQRGEAYRHVRLLDDSGSVIQGAFLEIEPELWNPERTRLTLLIDPGRIKRGLLLHEEMGPVLEPSRDYVLEVDAAWRDARGAPLISGLRRAFHTTATDLIGPAPERWQLAAPPAGSRDALNVRFDEILDRALARRLLSIEDAQGTPVEGLGRVDGDQRGWSFVPLSPWGDGTHVLLVPAILEDLTGNSVGRPFEVDAVSEVGTATGIDADLQDRTIRLKFRTR